MSAFRDDFERQAHDIICLIRYGGRGGNVRTAELREVADYLRGRPLDVPRVRLKLSAPVPKVQPPVPRVTVKLP